METAYAILIITNIVTLYVLIGYVLEVRTLLKRMLRRKISLAFTSPNISPEEALKKAKDPKYGEQWEKDLDAFLEAHVRVREEIKRIDEKYYGATTP